jgi:hypothetical protein
LRILKGPVCFREWTGIRQRCFVLHSSTRYPCTKWKETVRAERLMSGIILLGHRSHYCVSRKFTACVVSQVCRPLTSGRFDGSFN